MRLLSLVPYLLRRENAGNNCDLRGKAHGGAIVAPACGFVDSAEDAAAAMESRPQQASSSERIPKFGAVATKVQSLASLRPSAHGTKTVAPHRYGFITVPVSSA